MVTGASTADVAVILGDVQNGVLTQTKRHSFICSLLGIRHVALVINKMDLVEFNRDMFETIVRDYQAFAVHLNFEEITAIPMSALEGDNVVERSPRTSWFNGPTLIGFLETVAARQRRLDAAFRMPVQWVNRLDDSFRGFPGTIVSGQVKPGDEIRALPSGEIASVADIFLHRDSLPLAFADQAVTITLDREIDCSRGDLLVSARKPSEVADQFEVKLVWMDQESGHNGRAYWLKTGTIRINATITDIKYKYNVNTLEHLPTRNMSLNDIGVATISVDRGIPFEAYDDSRALGAFVLIDRYSNCLLYTSDAADE